MGKNYFHVSSHGLETNDIFRSKEDFIRGMNDIALCVLGCDVCILAFCLMSNHFHFVLYGTLEECRKFAEEYITLKSPHFPSPRADKIHQKLIRREVCAVYIEPIVRIDEEKNEVIFAYYECF